MVSKCLSVVSLLSDAVFTRIMQEMTYDVFVGIDVSKAKYDVAWITNSTDKPKSKQFTNDDTGFDVFSKWITKQSKVTADKTLIVMEATGVYHENLAYRLHELGFKVAVINPAYAKQFAGAMGSHTKTDKQDAKLLSQYACMKQPDLWKPDSDEVRYLKQLIARLDALEADKRREQNRLEKLMATKHDEFLIESLEDMLENIDKALTKIQDKIDTHIDNHPDLKQAYDNLMSIPSIGVKSAPRLLNLLKSKQFDTASKCASFVGLTPVQNQSGVFKGKSRISKKGNGKLRAKLYMCAIVAIKHNPDVKAQYERLLANGKCKMVALIASMRKLLQICYGVVKHNSKYQSQISVKTV